MVNKKGHQIKERNPPVLVVSPLDAMTLVLLLVPSSCVSGYIQLTATMLSHGSGQGLQTRPNYGFIVEVYPN